MSDALQTSLLKRKQEFVFTAIDINRSQHSLRKLGRKALADSRCHFFFFAGLSVFSDFLTFSGLLSAFFADFFGSASFFLSFFSEDFERAEAAADFFAGDDFLSFNSLLAFEASPLLFFSFLTTLPTSRSMPVLANCLWDYPHADY